MTLVLPTTATRARRPARFSAYEIAVFAAVALLLLVAVIGPFLAPASMNDADMLNTLGPPDGTHWLGTDDQGRDIFWRIIAGARVSLLSSMLVVVLYSAIGMLVATLATVGPRWVDEVLMRVTDIGLALPGMVVALGFASALGPSLQSGIIALALTGWPMTARILRTTMAQTMTQPYVDGARILGASKARLMLKHVLPNSLDVLIVKWAGDISYTLLILAGLSFIGVGAQPPTPEWGAMISDARGYITDAWWAVAAPGAAIAINAIAFGLLADILQVRRDPALRRG